jgi:hypothetical protein
MSIRTVAVASGAILALAFSCAAATGATKGTASPGRRAADGIVRGRFERQGGPVGPGGQQPPDVPISGTITFTGRGHLKVSVRAGHTGRFTARLAPGFYAVSGRTPDIEGPGHKQMVCAYRGKIKVSAGHTRHLTVLCTVP